MALDLGEATELFISDQTAANMPAAGTVPVALPAYYDDADVVREVWKDEVRWWKYDGSSWSIELEEVRPTAVGDNLPGMIFPFAGAVVPTGYELCDGSAISRAAKSALFTEIGTVFGTGDGSTTFNVPDLRGRVLAGVDDMGGVAAGRLVNFSGMGGAGGAEDHVLTEAELAAHRHYHTRWSWNVRAAGSGITYASVAAGSVASGVWSGSATIWHSYQGSNQPHNNTQPTLLTNYIIKC